MGIAEGARVSDPWVEGPRRGFPAALAWPGEHAMLTLGLGFHGRPVRDEISNTDGYGHTIAGVIHGRGSFDSLKNS